jgi:group II intron reverse transcriptase/maturase
MKRETQKTSTSFIEDNGEAKRALDEGAMRVIARKEIKRPKFNIDLMEEVLNRNNLNAAFKRVKRNKGAAGVDGMNVDELKSHIHENFWKIKEALLTGKYQASPVRKVEIPKPNGGVRQLGIPTVVDRFIQQALAQVLQRGFDPTFSDSSFGFRPKRSAHGAIAKSKSIQNNGYHFVVDLDLAKFFDEVNHDRLMSRLASVIKDKRVLKLVRMFLRSGVLDNGLVSTPDKGTPQGGPLSPLLSNIVLDELDKELEARGHKFVRYADDCNIYVKTERAGIRVMESVTKFIEEKLKLRVNEEKSSVTEPYKSQFLGFSFTPAWKGKSRSRIAKKSLKRFKDKIRNLTSCRKRVKFEVFIKDLRVYLNGWKGYFGKSDCTGIFRDLDMWIRRRVRCFIWQQWRKIKTRAKKLRKFGVRDELALTTAATRKGAWRLSTSPGLNIAFPKSYFDRIGLPRLYEM